MRKRTALAAGLSLALVLTGCGGSTSTSTTAASATDGTTASAETVAESTANSAAETTSSSSTQAAAASETTSGNAEYEWKLGTAYSDPATSTTFNAFGETVQKFCDLTNEYTGGKVHITPYYDSVLGGSQDLYDQVSTNEIQVFIGQPMSTIDSRYGITSIPNLFNDYDEVKEKFTDPDSPFYQLMDGVLQENGLTLAANNDSVFRVFYNSKKEVHVPEDLKGMTVRIYEDTICQTYWSGLCSASVIPFSELFMSLQTGVVDGCEHTQSFGPSQAYQVCKYCSDINWQWTWGGAYIINSEALQSLPEDLQTQVRKAAQDAAEDYNTTWADYDAQCEQAMVDLGMTYTHLTDEERQKWIDYGESLTDKFVQIIGEDFYNQAMEALGKS